MSGILIVGHGSRSKEAQEGFNEIVEMVKGICKSDSIVGEDIVGVHMGLCSPSIEDGVEALIKRNPKIGVIKIIPYFLYIGVHIKEDMLEIIDGLRKKYGGIEFRLGKPLGVEMEIAKILYRRVQELC